MERFAPGFRERILARHTMNTAQMEAYNPNYVGGDINGGVLDIGQLFTRPVLRLSPYRTSAKGLYLCSSSTPPGGGVHGMCGYHAARRALKDVFGQEAAPLSGSSGREHFIYLKLLMSILSWSRDAIYCVSSSAPYGCRLHFLVQRKPFTASSPTQAVQSLSCANKTQHVASLPFLDAP